MDLSLLSYLEGRLSMNLEEKYQYRDCLEELARYIYGTIFIEEEHIDSGKLLGIFREHNLNIETLTANSVERDLS